MKKKMKNQLCSKELKKDTKSKKYTTDELIDLGKKYNKIEIAPPLFKK